MKSLLPFVVILLPLFGMSKTFGYGEEGNCPSFPIEQQILLHDAYLKGKPKDLGWTLAAITWQESFVGNYIVKMNTTKGNNSFGITHIEFGTAKWLLKIDNDWEVKQDIIPRLISDNNFAWDLALMKLETLKKHPWRRQVQLYNGINSNYGEVVTKKVRVLRGCFTLGLKYEDCFKPKNEGYRWQLEEWWPREKREIKEEALRESLTTFQTISI